MLVYNKETSRTEWVFCFKNMILTKADAVSVYQARNSCKESLPVTRKQFVLSAISIFCLKDYFTDCFVPNKVCSYNKRAT